MRPPGVVVCDPSGNDLPGLVEIEKQALVEQLVAHVSVEGFDVAVLHRLAGRNVMPFHVMLFAPAQDRVRGELGAVVGHDHLGFAAPLDARHEFANNPSARNRSIGDCCQAFARHVIDDVEDTKAAAARELVVDKVERSAGIRLRLNQARGTSSYRLAAASAFAHRQPLLAIEPVNAVDAGGLAFGPQQDEQAPIAEPAPLIGKLTQAGTQLGIGWPT
jgi:hypothetical protein